MSRFESVKSAPPTELFVLAKAFIDDEHPTKVDLGIGSYRDNDGNPWVFPVVRKAELALASDPTLDHEYLGRLGLEGFTKLATELLLGKDCSAIAEGRTFGVQSISGTGALRLGADFLTKCADFSIVYISDPTWVNHPLILKYAGFKEIRTYRYWNSTKLNLDIEGMLEDLRNAPKDSVIILHTCAHNQTGIDPTEEQWKLIAQVMQEKSLFPFFDCAYQGFASGDLVKDSFSVRHFVSLGFELFCAQSFAKNFGLYNERAGSLACVVSKSSVIPNMKEQMSMLVQGEYSNPPSHGVQIVARVLADDKLTQEWHQCIKIISDRLDSVRKTFCARLEQLETPGDWSHITTQIGMFSFTGLSASQVAHMATDYHIYMPSDGRMNICGLNTHNIHYVTQAFDYVVRHY